MTSVPLHAPYEIRRSKKACARYEAVHRSLEAVARENRAVARMERELAEIARAEVEREMAR